MKVWNPTSGLRELHMYETRNISPGLMRSNGEVRELHNEAKTHPPQSSVLELSLGGNERSTML